MTKRPFKIQYIALVTCLAIYLFGHGIDRPAYAGTSVDWTPSQVLKTIEVGQTVTVQVQLKANEKLGDVALRVVPELAPYVSVQPASLSGVVSGSNTPITVRLTAAANAPLGTFNGAIQIRLRDTSGKTLSKPLPVTISIVASTQLGQDLNNDGIWDDLETFIGNYANSPQTVAALKQYAKAYQQKLEKADDKAASIVNYDEFERALTCLLYVRPNDGETISSQLGAAIIKTEARLQAYFMLDRQLAGTITKGWPTGNESAACRP